MTNYQYSVSLRISHPNINPEEITAELKLNPIRKWKAGEKRTTPKGDVLEGLNKDSYWTARLHESKKLNSEDKLLEEFLMTQNDRLKKHKEFFERIISEGGSIEYFVGWFGGRMIGATLEPELLLSTGNLNISIALDVYDG